MYIQDEAADEVLSKNAKIQDAVRGRTVMLVVPGHASYVFAILGLILGWMGSGLGAYGIAGSTEAALPYCMLASLVGVTIMSMLIYRVLRGTPSARRHMYIFALGVAVMSAAVSLVALIRWEKPSLIVATIACIASVLSSRTIAGANYAAVAAFFRAKRAYGETLRQEIERVRNGS